MAADDHFELDPRTRLSVTDRSAIMSWRKAQRADLLSARTSMPLDVYTQKSEAIIGHLRSAFGGLGAKVVGLYWPFRREINIFPFVDHLLAQGGQVAMPVVVEKNQPLAFRLWRPGDPIERGVYDIPYPAKGGRTQPEALIVALVGFDEGGYRLGYGGGYYDRTLAAATPRPLTIGVGFERLRLSTIHPLPHDIPMDFIVTETGVLQRKAGGLRGV